MSKVGFIGLGIMGKPMASRLLDGGHELYVFDIVGVPEELSGKGAKSCQSSREVAEKADTIIIMVPDTPDVQEVLFGDDAVAEGLSEGNVDGLPENIVGSDAFDHDEGGMSSRQHHSEARK